jgi:hypothetical protein
MDPDLVLDETLPAFARYLAPEALQQRQSRRVWAKVGTWNHVKNRQWLFQATSSREETTMLRAEQQQGSIQVRSLSANLVVHTSFEYTERLSGACCFRLFLSPWPWAKTQVA